ncbi:MAG TPA: cadmium-translocating P-type ATPase [Candidatus Omnitrophica bacterium]|nr:cadmium-translocating P-type ATPase [Candidatus Omnitrophota bacterium]
MGHREDNNHDEKSCQFCAVDFFEEKESLCKKKRMISGAASAALLAFGLVCEFLISWYLLAQVSFLLVVAISGREIIKRAFKSLFKKRRLNMNFLMSIATLGAFLIGHGEEGAAVMFLFFIAESLEDYAAERARRSISELIKLAPEIAKVKREGKEIELHVHEVNVGDVVVVRPGEKIPLDGEVIKGSSSVNQAPITGESIPVEKTEGDEVYAGTINEEGYLEIKVTKRGDEGILSKIAELVEEAEKKKSKTEAFIKKFARIYTPIVILMAVAVAFIPTIFFGLPVNVWVYRALVLLVVSCPCALAISTPVSMVSAITSATRRGVLIKGSTYLEELNKIKAFAFDKTGTLTEGKLEVSDIVSLNQLSNNEILSLAASIEFHSEHPIAQAIFKKAQEERIKLEEAKNFRSISGKGIRAQINGKTYYVGARNLFNDLHIQLPEKKITRFEQEGKTTVFLSEEKNLLGAIAMRDRIRASSFKAIEELKRRGLRTEMITGDNQRTARAIAEEVGIDEYHAQLLPEDKVKIVDKLTSQFGSMAFVGDGVNDAPSLANASVGIAMGAIGSDVALETADIALMEDDLSKIPYLIHLAKKTSQVVKQNVYASIIIKSSFAILALLGLINLWIAVAIGDMGLSLAVIINALRLTKVKS